MRIQYFLVVAAIVCCIIANEVVAIPSRPTGAYSVPFVKVIDISKYFPAAIGSKWEYKVTVGKEHPIVTRLVRFNIGNRTVGLIQRNSLLLKEGSVFSLVIEVKEIAQLQGQQGIEVGVIKDELGFFEGADRVVWIFRQEPSFMVFQILVSQPAGEEEILSVRPLIAIKAVESKTGTEDVLTPVDYSENLLHLVRKVASTSALVDNGYTEHYYYKKGIGLVRLEQEVKGEVSMTWDLITEKE